MKNKKRLHFPVLLKVILLGIITSFIASTVAIVVNFNNMTERAKKEMNESANQALEYSQKYYDNTIGADLNVESFKYVRDYVLKGYNNSELLREAELDKSKPFTDYEQIFKQTLTYFYADGMFMTKDYPEFYKNYVAINQILLNASYYSGQATYYAIKDPNNDNRFIFLCDSRIGTLKNKNEFYHCPGSHYDIKPKDQIIDIGHEYIKGYKLSQYNTRFIELKRDLGGENEFLGYLFVEYETSNIFDTYKPILINEILILLGTSIAVILIYALLSYLMFVKNINKLNKTAVDISNQLQTNKQFEPINPNINSHDEMSTLSESFVLMENQISNYVDIIKADAREKEKINAELEIASKIQLEALPIPSLDDSHISIRAFMKPAKEVGGDFYDYFYINDNEIAVIISDVSGKGVPASLLMMKSKELIKSKLMSGADLTSAVKEVNQRLNSNNEESLFVTSFIGIINVEKEVIRYINAGHEKPFLIHNKKVIKLDGTSNFVLGGVEDFDYIEEQHKFHKGDILFMYTDGLNESINDNFEEFSYERIESTLADNIGISLDGYVENMKKALADFVGDNEAFDDVTMVAVRLNEDELSLSFKKKDVSIIEEAVDQFNKAFSFVDEETRSRTGIILDELLNNLLSYEEREDLEIDINFLYQNEELNVEIISNGNDYNPFANNTEKYLNSYSDDIEEGGFGISLVKSLSKETKYVYKSGHSIIKLKL